MALEDTVRGLIGLSRGDRDEFVRQRAVVTRDYDAPAWIAFVRAWQDVCRGEYPIPELITSVDINHNIGVVAYNILGIRFGNSVDFLRKTIEGYGIMDDEKCRIFIDRKDKGLRGTLSNAFFEGEHAQENARTLVRYAWNHIWKQKRQIPELVRSDDINESLGSGIYRPFRINDGNPAELLRKTIEGYGVIDGTKCQVFLDEKENGPLQILSKAFFEGEYAQDNARTLVRYAWNHQWKQKRQIPELITKVDIGDTVGVGVYRPFGILVGNSADILRKTIEGYGIMDDEKCLMFMDQKSVGSRRLLSKAFFEGEYAQENARTLVRYAWNHMWKQKRHIPELVDMEDIQDKLSNNNNVYSVFGMKAGNPVELLRKTIDGYGRLDNEKVSTHITLQEKNGRQYGRTKAKLNQIFFADSEHADANKQCYLEAYQRHYQKRRSDFTDEDYQRLPKGVRSWVREQDGKREPPSLQREVGYHTIHIAWTPDLEAHLKALFEQHGQALFQRRDMLWSELGITPFAARMKAAGLDLIAPIVFGTEPSARVASYAFVQYPHYSTSEGMLAAAQSLDDAVEVHIEGFESPVHRQGLHLQVPILYKGINLQEYTPREQAVIRTVATYLNDPNKFDKRAKDRKGLPCYSPPHELVEPHTIVPIDTGTPNQLVKLYLNKQYAHDPGGVFSAVIEHTPTIFLFFHTGVGAVAVA